MTKNTVKIFISIVMIGIISFGLFVYFGFMGTPWQKIYHKTKIKEYLKEKYSQEMVIDKAIYNFKDGSYGVRAYPKNQPELAFSVFEHYDQDKSYQDYYPEVLWDHQVNKEFRHKIAALYPVAEKSSFHGIMGVSDEMNIRNKVPHYKKVNPHFTLVIGVKQKLNEHNLKKEAEQLYYLVDIIKDTNTDILIVYRDEQDDSKNAEKYINLYKKDFENITPEKIEQTFFEALVPRN